MDYMDEFLNTFDNEFDDDDFDDFDDAEQEFFAFDYPFHPDLAQRDQDRDRDRDRNRDHDGRDRRRVRCCVYRHRRTGRIRRICQSRNRRCVNRLGRDWILIDSFTAKNCNRCI